MEGDKEKEREHTHGIKKLNAEIFPFYLFIFFTVWNSYFTHFS